MLKAAVIGVGNMGRNHARVYREMEGVDLVAVSDANPQTATKVGHNNNVPFYTDPMKMIEECKPDLVSLAVPTVLHVQVATQLINEGIHVLIEKPIASSVEAAETLIELAKQKGVQLAVGHIERFNPAAMELRRRLRE